MSSGFPAVLCQHRANPTSATELCQLWCEIQLYSGAQCASCPSKYIGQPEESLLCGLWAQLIELGNAATPQPGSVSPSVPCRYADRADNADLLCELWCAVEEARGGGCTPECPAIYQGDPEQPLLCALWDDLQSLIQQDARPANQAPPLPCPHSNNPTSSTALCDLWCAVSIREGRECLVCPEEFAMDPEASRLCPLWEELTQLEDDGSVLPPALSSAPCPFSSNPTSSFSLCQLWCGVQAYSGIRCEEPCPAPYIGDPEEEALCDLWQELETHMETTGKAECQVECQMK